MNTRSRCSAIWALGMIYEGKDNPGIAEELISRVTDDSPQPMEKVEVKRSAAIALGRMRASGAASDLRFRAEGLDAEELTAGTTLSPGSAKYLNFRLGLGWAVGRLEGAPMPPPQPLTLNTGSWFLEPLQ